MFGGHFATVVLVCVFSLILFCELLAKRSDDDGVI
jgi:hypothetical protein